MDSYAFRDCTQSLLYDLFGLQATHSSPVLENWLKSDIALSDKEVMILEEYQERLLLNRNTWNEQELAMSFIGPILSLVNFTEPYRFNLFSQRRIKAHVPSLQGGEIELSGEPDGLIATGYFEPKVPMFAFTEYKRQLEPDGDPIGQTLAAMLVGQALDQIEKPLYGAYVVGHDWYFLVLEKNRYTISAPLCALCNAFSTHSSHRSRPFPQSSTNQYTHRHKTDYPWADQSPEKEEPACL